MPDYISTAAELADAMQPSAKEAMEWAVSYRRLQKPQAIIDGDGVAWDQADAKKELDALNTALKRWVEANGDLDVEGVGTLTLQHPQSEKVDLISLHQRDPETFFRMLELGCLSVNMDALKAQEKAGMIAALVPRMPVAQSPRLVWVR